MINDRKSTKRYNIRSTEGRSPEEHHREGERGEIKAKRDFKFTLKATDDKKNFNKISISWTV